jgi:hypothetical protein
VQRPMTRAAHRSPKQPLDGRSRWGGEPSERPSVDVTVEQLARQPLTRTEAEPERPVEARAVADFLGLQKTDWVYRYARELGGFTLGTGKKPRWRFLLSEVPARLRALQSSEPVRLCDGEQQNANPRKPRRRPANKGKTPNGAPLLHFETISAD